MGLWLEEEVHRHLVHEQVGIDRCQETEFEGVITSHGVASLTALGSE